MLEVISNGYKKIEDKPWITNKPCRIEELKEVLSKYTLDPIFLCCGGYIRKNPKWKNKELAEKYKGCTQLSGNFLSYSHVFNVITNDEKLISELEELINNNINSKDFINANKIMNLRKEYFDIQKKITLLKNKYTDKEIESMKEKIADIESVIEELSI